MMPAKHLTIARQAGHCNHSASCCWVLSCYFVLLNVCLCIIHFLFYAYAVSNFWTGTTFLFSSEL